MRSVSCAAALIAAAVALDAGATAQRTFVASTGLDSNPCSLAAPCRSFAAAIAQTNAGGEVIVLDSAGYGPIALIDKSITIASPPGVYAGISVPTGTGSTGILIDAPGIEVVLRGLTINGLPAPYGVRIENAAVVHIENCVLANFSFRAVEHAAGRLYVKDTIVRDNGVGLYTYGGGVSNLDRVRLENNSTGLLVGPGGTAAAAGSTMTGNGNGVFASVQSPGGSAAASIARSMIANNLNGIGATSTELLQTSRVDVVDSVITDNGNHGIRTNGLSGGITKVTALRNTIARNAIGVSMNGGTVVLDSNAISQNTTGIDGTGALLTRVNNTLRDNATDDTFSGTTTVVGGS
jgi:hypothetical protein